MNSNYTLDLNTSNVKVKAWKWGAYLGEEGPYLNTSNVKVKVSIGQGQTHLFQYLNTSNVKVKEKDYTTPVILFAAFKYI